jgi:hypothetical protein
VVPVPCSDKETILRPGVVGLSAQDESLPQVADNTPHGILGHAWSVPKQRLDVGQPPFGRDNHYSPCVYLRGFAGRGKRISVYRTLVSLPEVPLWKESSTKGVGYRSHLYTRIAAGCETDEIESWLKREFEDPAAEPLEKATSGGQLTSKDWTYLVRFLAAQIVRTPAYFVENLPRWRADLPGLLNSTLQEAVQRLDAARKLGKTVTPPEGRYSDYLPIRVTKKIVPGQDTGQLRASIVVGRGVWLFNMRRLLAGSAKVLHDHKWSILAPHEGLSWLTSDDPVIRLNYYDDGKYDFKGGCGKSGTEILLPISPRHLIYTQVGHRPPPRGEVLSRDKTETIRRFIAEHAYRMIFAASRDDSVSTLRPRIVDAQQFRCEQQQWQQWHAEQTAAERNLLGSRQS